MRQFKTRRIVTSAEKALATKKRFRLALATIAVVLFTAGQILAYFNTTLDIELEGYKSAVKPVSAQIGAIQVGKWPIEPSKDDVIQEIKTQSALFGVNTVFALELAECESGFDYKAKNINSTARGTYQYLIGTWEETESAKAGKERNNYKANIREAMLDMANGEYWRWQECLNII